METIALAKCELFHTPASTEELLDWIENLNGEERIAAMTAAMMAWILASELVEGQKRRRALGHEVVAERIGGATC